MSFDVFGYGLMDTTASLLSSLHDVYYRYWSESQQCLVHNQRCFTAINWALPTEVTSTSSASLSIKAEDDEDREELMNRLMSVEEY